MHKPNSSISLKKRKGKNNNNITDISTLTSSQKVSADAERDVQKNHSMDINDMNIVFADKIPPSIDPTGTLFKSITEAKGLNARSKVLLVISGLLLIFLIGNYALYAYAQNSLPPRPRKKKPVSAKKLKKEKLKHGVFSTGE